MTSVDAAAIIIPQDLRPADGRFGSGPSKVRSEALQALADVGSSYMGTSHRRTPVRSMVHRLKEAMSALFGLPEGYEVVLGNGGATAFWDAMAFGLVGSKSMHYVFGEFSAKCADAIRKAPHLEEPRVVTSDPGSHPTVVDPREDEDVVALTHNETSTGVSMPVDRPRGDVLVAVDATSAAGGLRVSVEDFDVYYFAPQKCFASDGGLWIALVSPAGLERIGALADSGRYIPASLNLQTAVDNARKDQTYNTPALATLFLTVHQAEYMVERGGLDWAAGRCDRSAEILYGWAEASAFARPFVTDPSMRSHVVGTIDFNAEVDAAAISAALRANGIVDTEPYRKLGRNQLRVAMYPAIDPEDIERLTACIDHVVERLGASEGR